MIRETVTKAQRLTRVECHAMLRQKVLKDTVQPKRGTIHDPVAIGLARHVPAGRVHLGGGEKTAAKGAPRADNQGVHLDGAIGTLPGAQAATDAPILNNHLARAAAVN